MTLESFVGHSPQFYTPAFVSDCVALKFSGGISHHSILPNTAAEPPRQVTQLGAGTFVLPAGRQSKEADAD